MAGAPIRNGWSDHFKQLLNLADAVKALCTQKPLNAKLGAATDQLMHYQARDFPEPLRSRFTRLMEARVKAARQYGSVTVFDFGRNRHEHEALRQAIFDLYKACALDFGAIRDRELVELAYPETENRPGGV